MKSKLFKIIPHIIILLSFVCIFLLLDFNDELIGEIQSKDSLINNISYRDSVYYEKTKEYYQTLTKYINETKFLLGEKEISEKELVELFNKVIAENNLLKDSLLIYYKQYNIEKQYALFYKNRYQLYNDSSAFYKFGYDQAKKTYGFDFDIVIVDSLISLKRNFSKADSALLIYPYYKQYLKKDTSSNSWYIITSETKIVKADQIDRRQTRLKRKINK